MEIMEYLKICLIVCPLIFLGSFVDSVAGGGGIITLPAYMLAGLPVHTASGTNKLVAVCGSVTASYRYLKSGNVMIKIAVWSAIGSLLGGALGARLALFIPEDILEIIMMIILPVVAVFLSLNKSFGMEHKPKKIEPTMERVTAFGIGLLIGCYDGMIGPGTGTFLIIAFSGILGLDLLVSGGCAKVSNMASNIASGIVWLFNGKAMYSLLLPAALCSIAGGYIGAKFAIKGGSKRIKKVMFVVLALLFVKMIYDYLF
jgi:uncharacterized membrane protein YfcA